jgi:hypothetical protein
MIKYDGSSPKFEPNLIRTNLVVTNQNNTILLGLVFII